MRDRDHNLARLSTSRKPWSPLTMTNGMDVGNTLSNLPAYAKNQQVILICDQDYKRTLYKNTFIQRQRMVE